jgi:hypothetical protein
MHTTNVVLRPWIWRWHVPQKRQLTFNRLRGVIFQKIELSNLKHCYNLLIMTIILSLDVTRLHIRATSETDRIHPESRVGKFVTRPTFWCPLTSRRPYSSSGSHEELCLLRNNAVQSGEDDTYLFQTSSSVLSHWHTKFLKDRCINLTTFN